MESKQPRPLKIGLTVWILGMIGVVAMAVYLPEMIASFGQDPSEAPSWLPLVFTAQYGILVAICAASGARFAGRLDLHAPMVEAALSGGDTGDAARRQLVPGVLGGVAGTVILVAASMITPEALVSPEGQWQPPFLVRILYGGITEEVFLRWGVMTALAWLLWRFGPRRDRPVGAGVLWSAIVLSAVVFGIGHLPAAVALVGSLTVPVVAYIVLANTAFGLVAGWLFWKSGLEAAILAHMLAHVGSVAILGLTG